MEAAIRRGKVWVQPDGDVSKRFLGGSPTREAPPFGTVFIRDDPYTIELYGEGGEMVGQAFLSDGQRRAIVAFLSAGDDA